MSMDVLKNKIRKLRNPSALTVAPTLDSLPPSFLTEFDSPIRGMGEYCCRALEALKGLLPAVKVSFGAFSLLGPEGLTELKRVLDTAAELGYYVILDWQRQEDETSARAAAKLILSGKLWKCDAVVLSCYPGSGSVKPYITESNKEKKDVFVVLKTGGKSGSELQDLQTGGRTVYTAAADLLARWGDQTMERCGYSRVAGVGSASHSASLRNLRAKYPKMFLLVDGLEAGNANARNASFAFDNLGGGALVCSNLLTAWIENPANDPIEEVVAAAQRMKRNVTTYVIVL